MASGGSFVLKPAMRRHRWQASKPGVRRNAFVCRATLCPGAVGRLRSPTGSRSSCQVAVPTQLPPPGPRLLLSPGWHQLALLFLGLSTPVGFLKPVHRHHTHLRSLQEVPSDPCQSLAGHDTKHSVSLFRYKVCACFLELQTKGLFQIHFPASYST